jgi:Tol biopolymer transport system component
VSGIQASAQPLTVWWLSFVANGNAQVPIRINPATGLVDLVNGVFVDSRFPSLSADGRQVVFQVSNGTTAQIWQAVWDATNGRWQVNPVPIPQTDPPRPLIGIHPVVSADGNHIAFASTQPYSGVSSTGNKWQIYVLDRLQNRIVPISFLWQDTDRDGMIGMRDTFVPSNGNCVPVAISADGRIVVFLAEWLPDDNLNVPNHAVPPDPATDPLSVDHTPQNQESRLYIVDENGDGRHEPLQIPPTNQPQKWLVLVHDRDADGNGIYDEAGIGATRTFVASVDNNGNYLVVSAVSVSANGRTIAFATPDTNNPDNWHLFIRDWQSGTGDFVRDSNNNPVLAFAPVLSDDGTYLAYLSPANPLNEQTTPPYFRTTMDLVMRQLIDPTTGQPPAQIRELRLSRLQLPPQTGAADGSVGYGYNDWWGAVTLAVDPRNSNVVYAAFHAWSTELIDFQQVRNDLTIDPNAQASPLRFYQGVPNIFLARFDFTNFDTNPQAPNRIRLWRLTEWTDQQQMNKRRGLPVSLTVAAGQPPQYRLTLTPNLLPAVSFVNGNQLAIAFQSLAAFDANDTNGLWDIYLANVLLP